MDTRTRPMGRVEPSGPIQAEQVSFTVMDTGTRPIQAENLETLDSQILDAVKRKFPCMQLFLPVRFFSRIRFIFLGLPSRTVVGNNRGFPLFPPFWYAHVHSRLFTYVKDIASPAQNYVVWLLFRVFGKDHLLSSNSNRIQQLTVTITYICFLFTTHVFTSSLTANNIKRANLTYHP